MSRRSKKRHTATEVVPPVVPGETHRSTPFMIAILMAAAVVRIASARNDLWLDEIWSLNVATAMDRVLDVFTLHHEINHYANTLWLHLVGAGGDSLEFRGLSLVAGIASVAVAGLIGKRQSTATGIIAMILVGASYELIVFSSEARGYSLLVCSALCAYAVLERSPQKPTGIVSTLSYNGAAVAGILAHPLFISVLGAGVLWTMVAHWRARTPLSAALRNAAGYHAVPMMVTGVLYTVDLRLVVAGGGTAAPSLAGAFLSATAWTFAPPRGAVWTGLSLGLVVASAAMGLRQLLPKRADVWVFFLGAAVVLPLLLMIVRQSDLVYARHFIVGNALFLILASVAFGAAWERGGFSRGAVAVGMLVYLAANTAYTRELLHRGRGQYSDALRYLIRNTPEGLTSIGGDQDLRVGDVMRYYLAAAVIPDIYVPRSWEGPGVQWIVAHAESSRLPVPPAMFIQDRAGNSYKLDRIFPSAPLTGLHWFLYRNEGRADTASANLGRPR